MDDAQRSRAIDLLASGMGVRAVAREVGVSAPTISRLRQKAMALSLPPPHVAPAALPTGPRERLTAIRDLWLTVAEKGLGQLARDVVEVGEDGATTVGVEVNTRLAIQLGIASQRAAELHRLLVEDDGLPDELPANDEEARELVRRLCWRVAKRSGQAGAWKMAAAVGLTSARQQPVEIVFERPSADDADNASAAPALPAESSGLQ